MQRRLRAIHSGHSAYTTNVTRIILTTNTAHRAYIASTPPAALGRPHRRTSNTKENLPFLVERESYDRERGRHRHRPSLYTHALTVSSIHTRACRTHGHDQSPSSHHSERAGAVGSSPPTVRIPVGAAGATVLSPTARPERDGWPTGRGRRGCIDGVSPNTYVRRTGLSDTEASIQHVHKQRTRFCLTSIDVTCMHACTSTCTLTHTQINTHTYISCNIRLYRSFLPNRPGLQHCPPSPEH